MSGFFEWNAAKFGLGVHDMDDEHQQLIDLMNKLHALYAAHAPASEQGQALTALLNFTGKHFKDEEAYMEKIKFPGLRVHQGVHRQLLERMNGFAQNFKTQGKLGDDLFVFLRMWLSAHICGIDMKYSMHATEHKQVAHG
jgi:hemerythrin-like metal-binding protein